MSILNSEIEEYIVKFDVDNYISKRFLTGVIKDNKKDIQFYLDGSDNGNLEISLYDKNKSNVIVFRKEGTITKRYLIDNAKKNLLFYAEKSLLSKHKITLRNKDGKKCLKTEFHKKLLSIENFESKEVVKCKFEEIPEPKKSFIKRLTELFEVKRYSCIISIEDSSTDRAMVFGMFLAYLGLVYLEIPLRKKQGGFEGH